MIFPLTERHSIQQKRTGNKSLKVCGLLVALSAIVPMAEAGTYDKTTPENDDGQGLAIMLDRHQLNCETDAISQLQLFRPTSSQIAYNYTCFEMRGESGSDKFTTAASDEGGGTSILENHTLNCEGSAIQFIHLKRPSTDTIQYHYKCSDKKLSNEKDYFTMRSDDGIGHVVFLDRHHVSCPNNEVLSYLRLDRPRSNNIRYHYKCGKYNEDPVNGFNDEFSPNQWNIAGVALASMSESSLSATVNSGGGGVTATITAPTSGTINFDWEMNVNSPGQFGDVIRYVVNGVNYDLSNAGTELGSARDISVMAGDTFEFQTWGTSHSSSYSALFDDFSFIPEPVYIPSQCGFSGDNQGRDDEGFTGQTFVYRNTSYGTDRFMWNGVTLGEVGIGTGSVTDLAGNEFRLGAQVSNPYEDVWYYEVCVN